MEKKAKTFHLEGYGCSLNQAETERIALLLESSGFKRERAEKAAFLLLNTCAVKTPTENKMLKRARELSLIAKKSGARLVVCGCLPLVCPEKIKMECENAELLGTSLAEIAGFFEIPFSSKNFNVASKKNECISIIPIAQGCLGNCTYCCVKNARGSLKSLPVAEIESAFTSALECSKEIWLTANDTGCYGFEKKTNLAVLLENLLKNNGDFRIRLGMMNPANAKKFFPKLLRIMEDERVYKFLHMPVQSGSDKILQLMERHCTASDFEKMAVRAREKFPNATLATDIIVAFPQETEKDFNESLALLERVKPDIVNVSRFGARPGTIAASLPGKISGSIAKQRTRIVSAKARELALERNSLLVGCKEKILVSEKGSKGGFIGRTNSYKPVAVGNAEMCCFAEALIKKAFPTYLEGEILHKN
ncbi:MAG: tRNA (N(6)-L-threonylcarbamoyladenosine(37)-C(2))-methylthiotransferase [Candidatus Diapherotrites archaeon]